MDGTQVDIPAMLERMGMDARAAAQILATSDHGHRQDALRRAGDALMDRCQDIIQANGRDLDYARDKGLDAAMLDRLMLDDTRVAAMRTGLHQVADQPDPVGEVIAAWDQPSGLHITRVRTPIGVIGVIYESRPNVTADAGALCLKSGNAAILRGGSESFHSSEIIHACLIEGLVAAGLPATAIQRIPVRDRAAVTAMLGLRDFIDVIIPRGGPGLVGLIQREARVPVFAHLEGICHVYLDRAADLAKARRVVMNAKTRRTGICGAAECLLIDRAAIDMGRQVVVDLLDAGVCLHGCSQSVALDPRMRPATDDDWGHEYLSMDMAVRVVDGLEGAVDHIRRYGSQHTDAILTEDPATAQRFFTALDSAILMHNASTQFADGAEFGMGAEIGIATGKLHARGPVGAQQLTSFKYLVTGDGTVRP